MGDIEPRTAKCAVLGNVEFGTTHRHVIRDAKEAGSCWRRSRTVCWSTGASSCRATPSLRHGPLDLYGLIAALPAETAGVPWDGPRVRVIEHQAHAPGHAALFVEERGVLAAGDMLSDVLVPMLDLDGADPVEDYLAALRLLEDVAGDVDVLVPGHGSVCGAGQVQARIERDRAYVLALREGRVPSDPRIGPSAQPGWEWVSDVHDGQAQRLAERSERGGTRG
jgi:glyoxylase-like metal-dependent hydrolase (beta-lactamase superfamily II)